MAASLIPFAPRELAQILGGKATFPGVGPEDEPILAFLAAGESVSEIQARLGLSARGIQHRLSRLRRHFGVSSSRELSILLARLGFAPGTQAPEDAKGKTQADGE